MTFLRTRLRTTAAVAAMLAIGGMALVPTSASAKAAAAPVTRTISEAGRTTTSLAGCGWNESRGGERAYYEHCATDTNVWIQVKRWPRSNYHRCVGPGRTNLDADATGAWYDTDFRGGLCSHPGDTGP